MKNKYTDKSSWQHCFYRFLCGSCGAHVAFTNMPSLELEAKFDRYYGSAFKLFGKYPSIYTKLFAFILENLHIFGKH